MTLPAVPILFATHHQCGVGPLMKVAQQVCQALTLPFHLDPRPPSAGPLIAFDSHSSFDFSLLPNGVRGLHMVRDPRDMVLSCWFHHLHSDQAWLQAPRPERDGLGLSPYLRSHSVAEGMRAEMEFLRDHDIKDMLAWTYDRPGILEVSYEQMWEDRVAFCAGVFHHLGFTGEHHELAVEAALHAMATESGFQAAAAERSARIAIWRWAYTAELQAMYTEILGAPHDALGYEPWGDQP